MGEEGGDGWVGGIEEVCGSWNPAMCFRFGAVVGCVGWVTDAGEEGAARGGFESEEEGRVLGWELDEGGGPRAFIKGSFGGVGVNGLGDDLGAFREG